MENIIKLDKLENKKMIGRERLNHVWFVSYIIFILTNVEQIISMIEKFTEN